MAAPAMTKNVGKGMTALVVDDDSVVRMIHKVLLEKYGLQTQVATNGEEALALYRSGAHFDLVLIDKEMPLKDGVLATRELREMEVKSKIVGVTSYGAGPEMDAFIEAGLDDCLTKPLNPDIILRLINKMLLI